MALHDQYGRPYTRSPLMAQYFAGHMQMHYKRIALGYVILIVIVLAVGGAFAGSWKQYTPTWLGGTAGQYPNSERTRDGYYNPPKGEPDVYPSRLPDLTFPPQAVAPTTTAPAGDTDWYPCTPGSRNCS